MLVLDPRTRRPRIKIRFREILEYRFEKLFQNEDHDQDHRYLTVFNNDYNPLLFKDTQWKLGGVNTRVEKASSTI